MDVPAEATVATLREAFARWGTPARIRVDNGYPWGSTGDLPTELALWLAGLGVELVRNPPRRPQANGVVERSQEVAQRWADPACCATAAEVQERLDAMDAHQRAGFPEPASSRMALFPGLAHSGRGYVAAEEARAWSSARVYAALSDYAAARRVNARGLISVYGRNHYVGRRHAGRDAYVRLDAAAGEWTFELADGPAIGRAASGITYEAVTSRQLSATHAHRGKPAVASSGAT